MSDPQESQSLEVPSHRACARCRSQKVRCIVDESNPDICQRCSRTARQCVFIPLQKRKQRKRTDTRVAELERQMRAMRALLKSKDKSHSTVPESTQQIAPVANPTLYKETGSNVFGRDSDAADQVTESSAALLAPNNSQTPGAAVSSSPARNIHRPMADYGKDIVDRGLISMATAQQLFESYRKQLFPHYPFVPVSDSISADEMRETKPVLFLAIIAAAASKGEPELSSLLDREILQAYASRSLVQSEKSLEIVQALLTSAVWYNPPNKFGQLKYYEYIHMAATMAMDMGIGTRPLAHHNRFGRKGARESRVPAIHPLEDATNPDLSMTPRSRASSRDTGSIESRRTFLACYTMCTSVSLSLRRPNMLRANSYVKECLEYLELSPDALPSDSMLIAWVRLIIIADDIGYSFRYDDPGGIASIAELRTQLMLKDFAKRLDDWFKSVPEADLNGSLTITYCSTRGFLHEVALHVEHSPDDFKAPYQMGPIYPWDGDDIPTRVLAEAIAGSISSAHTMIDAFLGMDLDSSRALPVFSYVRVSFAAFVLAKLTLSASHQGSQLGRVLDRDSLKAEEYLDKAIFHVRAVLGSMRCRVPAIFLALLFKLRQWCMNPGLIEQKPEVSFLDAGMASVPNKPVSEAQSDVRVTLDGPRIVEHTSADESSPQTSADSRVGADDSTSGSFPAAGITPASKIFDPDIPASGVAPLAPTTGDINAPQLSAFLNPSEQMELDQNFFQFFGDADGLAEDGFTDLDDWSTLPTDLLSMSNNFNWPTAMSADESTML